MSEQAQEKGLVSAGSEADAQGSPPDTVSDRKREANRQNAQHSTGPRTPEGKAASSQNAVKHGIFVKQLSQGASPEAIAEMESFLQEMREHYQPVGKIEEM